MTYFLDVAETEHMTRSAERLHVAQPVLSRSIARLEREMGVHLFIREGRGIKLSEEGHLLKRHLLTAVAEIEQAKAEIARVRSERETLVRVHIGAASLLAIEAISGWMTKNPRIRIELAQANHPEEPADVSVETFPPSRSAAQRCFTERIMLAAPASMRFDDKPIPLASLAGCSFLSLDSSLGFRKTCDDLCAQHSFQPRLSLESDNPAVVRQTIALGLGVGFWPELSWGRPGENVQLVPLAPADFKRSIYISLREESLHARNFYDHLIGCMEHVFSASSRTSPHPMS